MFKQILVPLDGSELAERALPVAARLARASRATLHLVSVVDLLTQTAWAPVAYVPEGAYEATMQEAATYLATQRESLQAAGLAVQSATPAGPVAATLLDYERQAHIDLVVLCSHGRSGLARFALGSVAEQLLRYGTAPLLVARAFGPPLALTHAIVPLDGSARAEQALEALTRLERSQLREVTLLRVIGAPEEGPEAERYLAAASARVPATLSVSTRVEQGDPAACIAKAAGTEALVVMATHGRIGLSRWALGSVADRVAHSGVAGVLLLRSHSVDATTASG